MVPLKLTEFIRVDHTGRYIPSCLWFAGALSLYYKDSQADQDPGAARFRYRTAPVPTQSCPSRGVPLLWSYMPITMDQRTVSSMLANDRYGTTLHPVT